jgi:hypothetical protein
MPAFETGLVGWWRSEDICFELFANGDAELSIMKHVGGRGGKVQVIGPATVTRTAGADTVFSYKVDRIWKARFTGPCRRTHESGHWEKTAEGLGATFTPGTATELTLHRTGEDRAELCAATCVELRRETPRLPGRWRAAGFDNPSKPEIAWKPGDLLELSTHESTKHAWFGAAGAAFDRVDTPDLTARYTEPDTFAISFTSAGTKVEGTAKRLAGERLEVCLGGRPCVILERQYESDHHDIE